MCTFLPFRVTQRVTQISVEFATPRIERQTARMASKTIKQQVESHWLLYLVGTVITTLAIAVPVMLWICHEKVDSLTRDYEGKMASINRRLAGGDYLNVSKFLIAPDERDKVPPNSKFFPEESFYAPEPAGWTYKKMSDTDFYNTIYGEAGDKQTSQITQLAPMHVWVRGKWSSVKNHDLIRNIAPVIVIQAIPTKDLIDQLNLAAPFTGEVEKPIQDPGSKMVFKGDIVGAMLTESLYNLFNTLHFASNTNVNLLTVNKVKNVLYCQVLLTLRDVSVASRPFSRFYVNVEIIVISTSDTVYALCDFQPSNEPLPRGPVAAEVTQWLDGFAILTR